MSRSRRILTVALVAATVAAVAVVVIKFRKMDEVATETADDIEMQLDALDPITRAAVVEKLSARAVEDVEARRT
jgi:predicted metal-binding membrane protein